MIVSIIIGMGIITLIGFAIYGFYMAYWGVWND